MGNAASSPNDAGCTASELQALKEAKTWKDSCGRIYLLHYSRSNGSVMVKGVTDTLAFNELLKEDNVDVVVNFKEKTLAFRENQIIMKKKTAPTPLSADLLKILEKAVEDLPEKAADVLLNILKTFATAVDADGGLRVLAMTFETSFDGEYVRAKVGGLQTIQSAELRALKRSGVHGQRSVIDMSEKGSIRLEKRVEIAPPLPKKRKRFDAELE